VLRGIRAISDYEYEFQMAMMNRKLDPEIETLFMLPAEKYTYVSSRLIKGVFQLGGDVTALVPPNVVERLKAKKANRERVSREQSKRLRMTSIGEMGVR
jgi:pantetheine-phosphate adenylyltransferase